MDRAMSVAEDGPGSTPGLLRSVREMTSVIDRSLGTGRAGGPGPPNGHGAGDPAGGGGYRSGAGRRPGREDFPHGGAEGGVKP